MKPTFKTTALAILVALGVTACSNNDNYNPAKAPTAANQQANKTQANQGQTNKADSDAEKARLEAEKKAKEAEQTRLEAEKKAKEAADAKAQQEAEKARLEAEKKAKEAEEARLEAEKKAKEAADLKAKQEAEKARLEAEKKAKEAEQARLEAEKKAKEAADLKAKQEAEKARLEAEKKAAELKAQQESEKVANEWRSKTSQANIVEPHHLGYFASIRSSKQGERYIDGYDGTQDKTPIYNYDNKGYKLDYYQLAIEDKANPQVLGWHKGEIKSGGINGSEIVALDDRGRIAKRAYPEKVDYMFKNTPYSTYGAVYNNYESTLFAVYEKPVAVGSYSDRYQIGEYEVIDGNKTNKIKYNDSVKGAATYKGEVLAHVARHIEHGDSGYSSDVYINDKTPEIDGTVTINANFGPRVEENYTSAILDSKALGKVEFRKSRMMMNGGGIFANPIIEVSHLSYINGKGISLRGDVTGKDANEIVGNIQYSNDSSSAKSGDVRSYNAVFAAEKQPK